MPDQLFEPPEESSGSPWEPLEHFYQIMTREGLEELEWAEGSVQMYLKRATKRSATAGPGTTGPSLPMEFEPPESSGTLRPLKSPLAGIFYRSSSPASPPYVQEGDTVSPGMTLCIVEAMKVMNEIKADQRYRVVKVLIENGKPVTAGQPLFLLQPL